MCIVCELRKAAGAAQEKNARHVGVISEQLRADFKAHKTNEALAQLELEQKVLDGRRAVLLGEVTEEETHKRQEEIDALDEANAAKYEAESEALWQRVYAELDITDKQRNYSIDAETGEVTTRRRRGEEGAATDGR